MRARNIKPGFFENEILGQADPIVCLLFAGLWCLADKAGRLEDRPARIKAQLFPYRGSLDVNRYLTDLERMGFIQRYGVNSLKLIQVLNFSKHQSPHHTERKSQLPANPNSCAVTVSSPLTDGENPPDSLIPDSLIPDSPPTPLPGGKKKRRSKIQIIQGFSEEVRRVVNTLGPKWPTEGKDGNPTSPTSPQDFCQRVSEILDQGYQADILIQAAEEYISHPQTKYAAPQFFFGKRGFDGGEAKWVGFVKFILTRRENASASA